MRAFGYAGGLTPASRLAATNTVVPVNQTGWYASRRGHGHVEACLEAAARLVAPRVRVCAESPTKGELNGAAQGKEDNSAGRTRGLRTSTAAVSATYRGVSAPVP